MQLEERNFLGGGTFQVFAPGGSYYTFSIYSTYAHEMVINRKNKYRERPLKSTGFDILLIYLKRGGISKLMLFKRTLPGVYCLG